MAGKNPRQPSRWWTCWLVLVLAAGIWLGASGADTIRFWQYGLIVILIIGIEGVIELKLKPIIGQINREKAVSRVLTSIGTILAATVVFGSVVGSGVWWLHLGRHLWSQLAVDRSGLKEGLIALGWALALRFGVLLGGGFIILI